MKNADPLREDSRINHTALAGRARHIKTVRVIPSPSDNWSLWGGGLPIHDGIAIAREVTGTIPLRGNIVLGAIQRRD